MNHKIDRFIEAVLEANRRMNLTGALTYEELMERHVKDSLALLRYCPLKAGMKVLDVGTGAGFPGIPLAIETEADFVLLDSLKKRIQFLEGVCRDLNLQNVSLSDARAEDFLRLPEYRERFDLVCSRAVAPLNLLLEYSIPALKVGGSFFAYKSGNISEELKEAERALSVLKAKIKNVFRYSLCDASGVEIDLQLLEIAKLEPTSERYPRRVGIPAKRPL